MKKLQKAARDILGGGDGDDEEDDGDDGEDDWSDEEEACSTPLEELDPYQHLMDALAAMQAHMPARYATVVAAADGALQENLHKLHAHVAAEKAKQQQQQQQQQH